MQGAEEKYKKNSIQSICVWVVVHIIVIEFCCWVWFVSVDTYVTLIVIIIVFMTWYIFVYLYLHMCIIKRYFIKSVCFLSA